MKLMIEILLNTYIVYTDLDTYNRGQRRQKNKLDLYNMPTNTLE